MLATANFDLSLDSNVFNILNEKFNKDKTAINLFLNDFLNNNLIKKFTKKTDIDKIFDVFDNYTTITNKAEYRKRLEQLLLDKDFLKTENIKPNYYSFIGLFKFLNNYDNKILSISLDNTGLVAIEDYTENSLFLGVFLDENRIASEFFVKDKIKEEKILSIDDFSNKLLEVLNIGYFC
ncbi:MAG: hypothetical protein Ta2D_00400 [Rickettsiales bacterium]|nr:MAG: hypothetical protein Ta2D_00400 [Rickettsiales bacterium]